MTNFGVKPFSKNSCAWLETAAAKCLEGSVDPTSDQFTSFVFKIQANADPSTTTASSSCASARASSKGHVGHPSPVGKTCGSCSPNSSWRYGTDDHRRRLPRHRIGVFDNGTMGVGDTSTTARRKSLSKTSTFPPELLRPHPRQGLHEAQAVLKGHDPVSSGRGQESMKTWALWKATLSAPSANCKFEVLEYRL